MIPNNDLQQLVEMSRNTVVSTNVMAETLKTHDGIIKGLLKQADETVLQVNEISTKVENLELNAEITDEQRDLITSRVKARVAELIGYPSVYYQIFIANCYKYLRANHHLGAKVATTRKRNYDFVLEGIPAWHPDIKALKARKDEIDAQKVKHEQNIKKIVKAGKK